MIVYRGCVEYCKKLAEMVHIRGLFDLVNYRQKLGRAELDGKRLESIVVVTKEDIRSKFKDTEEKLMWKYLQTEGY